MNFRACYYKNDVDEAVRQRGIEWDRKTGTIK
jgi:hypothetical protein